MSHTFRFTPVVETLPSTVPFVGPEAQERSSGVVFRARLGANESGFGPSPRAIEAMEKAARENWRYGDPENHDLREALAAHHGVRAENIMIGEGIDGLYGYLARLFVQPGVHVVTSLGSYPTFNFHIKGNGGTLHLVPYRDDKEDRDGVLEKARETDAVLLYFSNPNNPMGTWWTGEETQDLIDRLPKGTVLALDEAYGELAPPGVLPAIDVTNPQVLRFRTFSKAYGLAGARVGYVIGHADLISAFDKIRNHYGMNRIGQVGALAALHDQEYLQATIGKVAAGRERIAAIAQSHGMNAIPSAANFVTIDCGRGSDYAKAVLAGLLARGVFVRMPGVEPQARCIRVSVGLDHEHDIFEEEFAAVLSELA